MSRSFTPNMYNEGDVVYAKTAPMLKLVIRRYVDQVYYCTIAEAPESKELVYFERELIEDLGLIAKNRTTNKGSSE